MSLIIQKYGGNLLNSEINRNRVISHITKALNGGHQLIIVVSAMGREGECYSTDTLLESSNYLASNEKARLLSLGEIFSSLVLSNQLQEKEISTYALTPQEIGIVTNATYEDSHPIGVDTYHIKQLLQRYKVIVVPGFLGINNRGEVTTLGRGGSDLTAILLAHSLGLWDVEVFKETGGVRSADPKIVPHTFPRPQLSYYQMELLSRHGAKVMQTKAVEEAWKKSLIIKVVPFFDEFVDQTIISEIPCHDRFIAITNNRTTVTVISTIGQTDPFFDTNDWIERPLTFFQGGFSFEVSKDVESVVREFHNRFFE